MKKNYQKWLVGALACALAMPFTGCSGEDDPTPSVKPGTGETFQTEISIALTNGTSKTSTKASDTEVQEPSADGVIQFNGLQNIKLVSYSINNLSTTDYAAKENSQLITIRNLQDIGSETQGTSDPKYIKQKQAVSLNAETQGFLFYGESAYETPVGKIKTTFPTTDGNDVSSINFELVEIEVDANDYKTEMEAYLKDVYTALYNYNPVIVTKGDGQTTTKLYNSLNTAESGSFMQIADLMAQLYVLANNNQIGEKANDDGDGSLDNIKNAIYSDENQTIFTVAPSGTYADETISNLSYTVVTDGLATALTDAKAPASNYRLSFVEHGKDGNTGEFLTEDENTYVSPASLYYYVNTYPVDYTQGTFEQLTWKDGLIESYNTPLDLKTSQPGFIAMAHSAQYAVGRLDIELNYDDNLKDRDGKDFNTQNDGLQLKGVIVGQQKDVAWNFLPSTATVTEKSIYDNTVEDNAAKVLVFPTSPTTNEVKVVLEMLNNTDNAFIGANGQKIPGHSTFYVVASLNKSSVDAVEGVNAIFQSDYKTTAKMTLKSLQNAYNTVPDLTATNLEFALSVDLSWQQGYKFEVDIE